jgi:hypothetical protein
MGSDSTPDECLKPSSRPRELHICVGNLDVGLSAESVKSYIEKKGVKVFKSDILISRRFDNPRCCAAHVVVDNKFKERVLMSDFWPEDISVRLWHFPRQKLWQPKDDQRSF